MPTIDDLRDDPSSTSNDLPGVRLKPVYVTEYEVVDDEYLGERLVAHRRLVDVDLVPLRR